MSGLIIGRETNFLKGITWAIIAGAVVVSAILITNGSINTSYLYDHFVLKSVKINSLTINVRIAKTPAEQSASLNGVSSMPQHEGMLFVFDKDGIYGISTKDMLFPVDLMWMDSEGTIVDAQANVAPGLRDPVRSAAFARYVLMVNAGVMDRNDIVTRTPVDISGIN